MGALSINGIPALRMPFEPLVPEVRHVKNTNRYHRPPQETEAEFTAMLLDDLESTILAMGPETVCLVTWSRCRTRAARSRRPRVLARRARALRPLRHPPLRRRGDHRLRPGRLLVRVGALRHPPRRLLRKGLSSSYAAIGAVLATDRVMEPFLDSTSMLASPSAATMAAIALKNIEIMKRERIMERVLEHEGAFRSTLEQLLDLPIVGDVRGTGCFYALELVKDRETRETFDADECETLLRGLPLGGALRARPHLPRRRPRRPRDPDLAPARRRAGRVRRAGGHPRRRARGGRADDERGG